MIFAPGEKKRARHLRPGPPPIPLLPIRLLSPGLKPRTLAEGKNSFKLILLSLERSALDLQSRNFWEFLVQIDEY